MDQTTENTGRAFDRKALLMPLVRMTIYYFVVATPLIVAAKVFPGFIDNIPVGGVGQMRGYDAPSIHELEDVLLAADPDELEQIVTQRSQRNSWLDDASLLLYAMFGDGLESHYLSAKKRNRAAKKRAEEIAADNTSDGGSP